MHKIRVKEKYQSVKPNRKHKNSQDLNLFVISKPVKHRKSEISETNKLYNYLRETGTDTQVLITHNQQTGKH